MSKDLLKIKTPITNADEDYLLNLPDKNSGEYDIAVTDDIKNATISINVNDSLVDSFTLNQSSNKTIDLYALTLDTTSGQESIDEYDGGTILPVTRDTHQIIESYKTIDCNDGNRFGYIEDALSQLEFINSDSGANQDSYAQLGFYKGTTSQTASIQNADSFRINLRSDTLEQDFTLDIGTAGLTFDISADDPQYGRFEYVNTILEANSTKIDLNTYTYANSGLEVTSDFIAKGGVKTDTITSRDETSYTNKIGLGGGNITLTAAGGANSTKIVRLSTNNLTAMRDISFPDASGSLATIAINPSTTTGTLTGLTINGTAYAIPQGTVTGSTLTSGNIIIGNGGTAITKSTCSIATSSSTWTDNSDAYIPTMAAIIGRWPKIIDIR